MYICTQIVGIQHALIVFFLLQVCATMSGAMVKLTLCSIWIELDLD